MGTSHSKCALEHLLNSYSKKLLSLSVRELKYFNPKEEFQECVFLVWHCWLMQFTEPMAHFEARRIPETLVTFEASLVRGEVQKRRAGGVRDARPARRVQFLHGDRGDDQAGAPTYVGPATSDFQQPAAL